jgi:hypothetical protein
MIELKDLMEESLVGQALDRGGTIKPLLIAPKDSKGTGLCNPSIYHVPDTTKYLVNVRNVGYYLHHCEGEQKYQTPWGPLNYVREDNDPYLRTYNFLCEYSLAQNRVMKHTKIDTSKFPKEPEWDFVGLEDARIVVWNDKTYITGVRRYAPDGKGRMVLSEISITKKSVKEVSRFIIEPPKGEEDAFCEKNWMPILDKPFQYVKHANPLQIVEVKPSAKKVKGVSTATSTIVHQGKDKLDLQLDLRGSSQVISYEDYYLCVTHECDYWHNEKNDRDAQYYHRFVAWDKEWNLKGTSKPFKFMDGRIEFCCGMAKHPDASCKDLMITFGFQDNSAYILQLNGGHFAKLMEN